MRRLLAAIMLLAIAVPAIGQPPALVIELSSYAYRPNTIQLAAGKPVTLTFINRSSKSHDFTARKFFAAARISAGSAPNGEIGLKGGESATVTLIPTAGSYSVHCGHFMHKQLGMAGRLVVR